MKLHLGCGQRYFDGYVNIDFPPASHSVQEVSVADLQTNILELNYSKQSIEEIRLHHVFEHFPRPIACGLLAGWFSWLQPNGTLHIEVPDFTKSALTIINPFSTLRAKLVAERHLFGSHEAHWAVHCEGYSPETLQMMLESFGFKVAKTVKHSWLGTHNFELLAKKGNKNISKSECLGIATAFLKNYLLDDGESESKLLKVWLASFNEQLNKSWALND